MKKLLVLFLLLIVLIPSSFASTWFEIFKKQYVDFDSIEIYPKSNIISFWVKSLRTDPKEKFFDFDYWYTMNKWSLSCNARFSRVESITVYDLKQKVLYSDNSIPDWNAIIPDTYAEGYYRLFCLVPFDENPFLKNVKKIN